MATNPTRKGFLVRAAALASAAIARPLQALLRGRPPTREVSAQAVSQEERLLTHGPFLGDLSPTSARIWARCSAPGMYRLAVRGPRSDLTATADARAEDDLCVVWSLRGLEPQRTYDFGIGRAGEPLLTEAGGRITTPAPQEAATVTRLAIGSCAREAEGSRAVWRRMAAEDPDAVVLLGDTPYIDSTDLGVQRRRYAEFAAVPEFAALLRDRPLYATWDDHDFGLNDSDGRLEGKENARRAFVEYRVNPSYGDGREGVYTKFRLGGVEIFLLDTRYFAGTERSPIADGPTALGRGQWAWLRDGLRASTSPFKILASGMIWNYAVRPGKLDHWDSYVEEKEALFRWLGSERVSGVVLLGGDVHRTRVLRYDTRDTVGYPLTELITSPMHADVIDAANAPHPDLIHDSGEPHSYLLLTVDTTAGPPTLHARFENSAGQELYSLTLAADELSA